MSQQIAFQKSKRTLYDRCRLARRDGRRIHGDKTYRGHSCPDRFRVWISGQPRRGGGEKARPPRWPLPQLRTIREAVPRVEANVRDSRGTGWLLAASPDVRIILSR
jgi:hypothetical protein